MPKIRVLVVDDSVVIRRVLTDALASDAALEVAGTAANGALALSKIPQLHPDLVTLDVEMPEKNGLETLAEIRRLYPRLPVIMVSSLTQRGAAATIEALSLGARDYITKPDSAGGAAAAMQRLRDELIPCIKALCAPKPPQAAPMPAARSAASSGMRTARGRPATFVLGRVDVLAIGVSTGGPNALAQLLPQLPAALPVPVVIVQHMPPLFTRMLAERLNTHSKFPIAEGRQGPALLPGYGWIAPGDFHMEVVRGQGQARLRLHQDMPENSCRPAVDVLFRSAAQTFGAGVLAVVLTGMGQDGLRGCERVHEAGGQILAQDEASSVVWGMPGAVAKAGLAHEVLPLDELAWTIGRRLQIGRARFEAAPPAAAAVPASSPNPLRTSKTR